MRQVRTKATIKRGVEVEMLFTPRLYAFNGVQGVTMKADTTDLMQVYSLYADIMFCAALNLWTLQGNAMEDAPFSRADFHEFSAANPQEFGKVLNFALEAFSGKSLKDFMPSAEKGAENGGKSLKKKSSSRLITILSRIFSLDRSECRQNKQVGHHKGSLNCD